MKRLFLGISPNALQLEQLLKIQAALFEAGDKERTLVGRDADKNSGSHQYTCVGRRVNKQNFHMTLAFLGAVSDEMQAQLESTLDSFYAINASQWPSFDVTLDTLTLWRKPQVLCLSGKADDPNLQIAVDRCRYAAKEAGLFSGKTNKTKTSDELTFTPHITLFRKAKRIPEDHLPQTGLLQSELMEKSLIPVTLSPQQMHLYESLSTAKGVEYRILRSWALVKA
ncbi:2'-5' RNA ligase [Shewanella sediminis HAW-EB3]|uniref:RNA 2',3'-cyclic phosphodiesterase n=1 Tax=Shewanella sediminis (strain HAW-EB3) TaxID=425104 RepID=A8G077_SHESH|nr:2'-5' RNA ligase family protein [Shewanella sediminis]ABV38500.1 2'-5' RNA ligase [Shewanella sediminis HAW-EB3]